MNALEHAVIEAARRLRNAHSEGGDVVNLINLVTAVDVLDRHEQALTAAGLREIPWAQVAEGDELRSTKGNFFPVTHTRREWKMGRSTGNFLITVRLPAGDKVLTRPTPAEPEATVRRGDAGKAVDMFVHVFESGEI